MQRSLYLSIGSIFFLLPLWHAWMVYPLGIENHMTNYSALGGLLPWSDAQGYYTGANKLLETGFLDDWNIRRPLNAILFAMRLWVTHNNFEAALILQALLCGISCLLVASSIQRTFGKLPSAITLLILFLFAATFIPTTLSESLGLTLGCLGFVLLWEAITSIKEKIHLGLFFIASFILMVGLNVRAGAFFIFPLLILWFSFGFNNAHMSGRQRWLLILSFTLGIVAGALFNILLTKLNYPTADIAAPHGNFSYVLFGLVSGGKNWTHATYLYSAELANKSEAEVAKFLYLKSWEVFRSNPFLLLMGIVKNLLGCFKGMVSFFCDLSIGTLLKALVRLLGFSIICLSTFRLKTLYRSYRLEIGFIATALLGIFLSAGIIWSDGGFRLFAVTVPFFAAAMGISSMMKEKISPSLFSQKQLANFKSPSFHWEAKLALGVCLLLLMISVIGPVINRLHKSTSSFQMYCAAHETALIVKDLAGAPHIDLSLKAGSFKKSLQDSFIENKEDFLKILELNSSKNALTLALIFDSNTRQTMYILGPSAIFLGQNKWTGLCVSKIPHVNDMIRQVRTSEAFNEQ